jgi:hypothetical protein
VRSIKSLNAAYDAVGSLSGPNTGHYRETLIDLQRRLCAEGPSGFCSTDIAAVMSAVEADRRTGGCYPPLDDAVLTLDAVLQEAAEWSRSLGADGRDAAPLWRAATY